VELVAWVEDSQGQALRIAEARVQERLSIKKAEEVIHVQRIAGGQSGATKQATAIVDSGNKLFTKI
jgi:hypothetical protein